MSNIITFERDMLWADASATVAGATVDLLNSPITVPTSGVVAQRHAYVALTPGTFTATGTSDFLVFGCQILEPPAGDPTPYRVRGAVGLHDSAPVVWGYGYADGASTDLVRVLGAGESIDDCWCIRPLQEGDANFGDPLVFFCGVSRNIANFRIGALSVQRLVSKPDQFATAVS